MTFQDYIAFMRDEANIGATHYEKMERSYRNNFDVEVKEEFVRKYTLEADGRVVTQDTSVDALDAKIGRLQEEVAKLQDEKTTLSGIVV